MQDTQNIGRVTAGMPSAWHNWSGLKTQLCSAMKRDLCEMNDICLPKRKLLACLVPLLCIFLSTQALAEITRGYAQTCAGQMHYYKAKPDGGATEKTPIIFFHPSPKSGQIYEHVLKEMGRDRIAIAIDSPGFGGSDPMRSAPSMTDIAKVMAEAIEDLGFGPSGAGKVDVFGFHTGSLIAAELALRRPDLVRRVVLSGIPLRSAEDRESLLAAVKTDAQINEDRVQYAWYTTVGAIEEGVAFAEAARSFSENIRALVGPYWHAYHAVWSYPIAERLPQLKAPALILNPPDGEYESTREAYEKYMQSATYVELSSVTEIYQPFIPNWKAWTDALHAWLDQPVR